MTDRELMQMALDVLKQTRVFVTTREKIKHPEGTEWYDERIEALRARLEQGEQEPVAWFTEDHREDKSATTYSKKMAERWQEKGWPVIPLYTAPPQREWQGLTVEEAVAIYKTIPAEGSDLEFAKAIEAKLKEKNT